MTLVLSWHLKACTLNGKDYLQILKTGKKSIENQTKVNKPKAWRYNVSNSESWNKQKAPWHCSVNNVDRKLKTSPSAANYRCQGSHRWGRGEAIQHWLQGGSISTESFQHQLVNDMYHYSEYNKALQKETRTRRVHSSYPGITICVTSWTFKYHWMTNILLPYPRVIQSSKKVWAL